MEELAVLHPEEEPPTVLESDAAPVQIDEDILTKVLSRLRPGVAGGTSGWTYEHIFAAARTPDCFEGLLRFVNMLLRVICLTSRS